MEKQERKILKSRIGYPVVSRNTRYAQLMPKNDPRLGLVKGGNYWSGLTGLLNGYFQGSGARQDYLNELLYAKQQAELAAQEREDKLAQQAIENDYKDRALAQQFELGKMNIDAADARAALARQQALADRKEQYAHEQAVYDRNREAALADLKAQNEAKQQAQYLSDMNAWAAKNLTAEDYAKFRENPTGYEIKGGGWWARKFGKRADLQPKQSNSFANLSDEDLLQGL